MDSYIFDQTIGLFIILIVFAVAIFLLSKLNKSEKIGCFTSLVIFFSLLMLHHIIGFKYFSSEVIGTTDGVAIKFKPSRKVINYSFTYKGTHYTGSNSYQDSIRVNGGRYKVVVSDLIFVNSWMDFSQPIK